jgi:hypothetical protein
MNIMKQLLITFCLAASAWPQTNPLPLPPSQLAFPQLKQYLTLTDAQISAIIQSNADYNAFSLQQQRQIQNAQSQIAFETTRDRLDPTALGTLYAGIENACRDLRDKAASAQRQNLAVLTDIQKAKLTALNDAMKLAPVISEAQFGNLLAPANSPPLSFTSFQVGLIAGITSFPPISGCAVPAPVVIPANRVPAP